MNRHFSSPMCVFPSFFALFYVICVCCDDVLTYIYQCEILLYHYFGSLLLLSFRLSIPPTKPFFFSLPYMNMMSFINLFHGLLLFYSAGKPLSDRLHLLRDIGFPCERFFSFVISFVNYLVCFVYYCCLFVFF